MRQLIIMRGITGSGKSTWIKRHGLSEYTISPDAIRVMMGNFYVEDLKKNMYTDVNLDNKVWDFVLELLERRMSAGQLTVIDALHLTAKDVNNYRELAEKYDYKVYVVSMPKLSIEESFNRVTTRYHDVNNLEDGKYIPHKTIERFYNLQETGEIPNWVYKLDTTNAIDAIGIHPINLKEYNGLITIGDIHSSYSCLKKMWKKLDIDKKLKDNYLVVLLGDLFDRGIYPVEVFNFINSKFKNYANFHVVMGNHDYNLFNELFKTINRVPIHTHNETTVKLINSGISPKEIRKFLRKFEDGLFLTSQNKLITITHGGILVNKDSEDPLYLNKIPTKLMISGSGKFDSKFDLIAAQYKDVITIHGHRNVHRQKMITKNYGESVNLEQGVDKGKFLAEFTLYPSMREKVNIMRNYEFMLTKKERIDGLKKANELAANIPVVYLKQAEKSDNLKVKDMGNNIYSINFTRNAFFKGNWDKLTVRARGLFIDKVHNSVFARGYNKFFRLGEFDNWQTAKKHAPFSVYKKYNGYLALFTYDKYSNQFVVASKTSFNSEFAIRAREIIFNSLNKNELEYAKELLTGRTALFEVVDESWDPHIVHNFDKPTPVLLDVINNNLSDDFHNNRKDYDELINIGAKLGFKVKEKVAEISNTEDLRQEIEELANNKEIEGYVLESELDGFQIKAKTYVYTSSKFARGQYQIARKKNYSIEQFRNVSLNLPYKEEFIVGKRNKTVQKYKELINAICDELKKEDKDREKNILQLRENNKLII